MEGECGRVSLGRSGAEKGYRCLPLRRRIGLGGRLKPEHFAFHFEFFLSCTCIVLIKKNS